jgi:hypothetical protein
MHQCDGAIGDIRQRLERVPMFGDGVAHRHRRDIAERDDEARIAEQRKIGVLQVAMQVGILEAPDIVRRVARLDRPQQTGAVLAFQLFGEFTILIDGIGQVGANGQPGFHQHCSDHAGTRSPQAGDDHGALRRQSGLGARSTLGDNAMINECIVHHFLYTHRHSKARHSSRRHNAGAIVRTPAKLLLFVNCRGDPCAASHTQDIEHTRW